MKAIALFCLVAVAQAVKIAPMNPDGRASIDFNDSVRQEHSDTVIDHLGNRVFEDTHNSLKHYHEIVRSKSADNGGDKAYTMPYPYPAKSQ